MVNEKNRFALRVLPSLTDVAFILPILFLFLCLNGATMLLGDGDTGWHLRTGEWIWQNGRVPHHDIFSFTKPGQPWYAWEWLWDVMFAWLHHHGGLAAVVVASIVVIATTYALLYRLIRRKCGNGLLAIAVLLPAMCGASIHWLARPHLFTLLFVVIWYSVLERVHDGKVRLLWLLPPMIVLWANLHGGFLAGIILLLTYAAGELMTWLVDADAEVSRAALLRAKPYLLCAAACAGATFINPYFYHLHVHIFRYLSDPFQYKHIVEFLSLNFQGPAAPYFELILFAGVVAAAWNIYRRRFVYSILLVGWAHLALFSARNIPVYMIVATPVVAGMLAELLAALESAKVAGWLQRAARSFRSFAAEFEALDRIGRVPVTSAAAAGLLVLLFHIPLHAAKFRAEYDPKTYPAKAIEVLRGPDFARGIFTSDTWGGYLIYRLYPHTQVFIDGRSDFYGAQFDERYLDVMYGKYDWENILEQYDVPYHPPAGGCLPGQHFEAIEELASRLR